MVGPKRPWRQCALVRVIRRRLTYRFRRGVSPLAWQVRPTSSRSLRLSSARPTGALRLRSPTIHCGGRECIPRLPRKSHYAGRCATFRPGVSDWAREGARWSEIRRPLRLPGRLVSRLHFRFRVFRDCIELADQSDHTSCQLGDPGGRGAVLGAERGLHAQKLSLRQQSGERVVHLVLNADDRLAKLAARCSRRGIGELHIRGYVVPPFGRGRLHRWLSHD